VASSRVRSSLRWRYWFVCSHYGSFSPCHEHLCKRTKVHYSTYICTTLLLISTYPFHDTDI
jgi:hypothetical protein